MLELTGRVRCKTRVAMSTTNDVYEQKSVSNPINSILIELIEVVELIKFENGLLLMLIELIELIEFENALLIHIFVYEQKPVSHSIIVIIPINPIRMLWATS